MSRPARPNSRSRLGQAVLAIAAGLAALGSPLHAQYHPAAATGATAAAPAEVTPLAPTGAAAVTTPPARATAVAANRFIGQLSPASIFVYDATGAVSAISDGETLQLTRHSNLPVGKPVTLQLKKNSSCALVFANGVGLWVKGPASFTIQRFEQVPFIGNSRAAVYEPTQSLTELELTEGAFAISSRNLSALSPLRISFGNNNVLEANEASSLVLQIGTTPQGDSDRISVLGGRALLHHLGRSSSLLIGSGQDLELQRHHQAGAQQMLLPRQLTTEERERDSLMSNHSQNANDRVWFVRDAIDSPARAQIILPANFWLSKPHEATRVR